MLNEPQSLNFSFPPIFSTDLKILGNPIYQKIRPSHDKQVTIQLRESDGQRDFLLLDGDDTVLAVGRDAIPSNDFNKVVVIETSDQIPTFAEKWIRHSEISQNREIEEINFSDEIQAVIQSWAGSFLFKTANENSNGLRTPQIGAIHAVLAHWSVSEQAATVVMPTGTGKTETMLSIMVAAQCEKILVVVPTDALRTQIAEKFLDLGVLKQVGVLQETAKYPIVGILKHKPKNVVDVDNFFEKCQVIVTTMAIAGRCAPEIQERMAFWCPVLFIDEAHHIGAQTWDNFRSKFTNNKILQFTATPFRNDGKVVGGKIVYNYPLGKAQRDGYFRKINFDPVVIYNLKKADQAIAEKAIAQLRRDREQFNHVLMARVDSIKRAREIFPLYERYPEFQPVVIHSELNTVEKKRARKAILDGEAKIVICVDMLGEGFDLPELKIAAFHDVKKSLPITLQLAGRFIRTRTDLGEATFIANIGDVTVQNELRKLFSLESDWNLLLQQSSESVIQNQVDLWEFLRGFTNLPEDIAIQNLRPALSTVIYRTQCAVWTPNHFINGIENPNTLEQIYHDVNVESNVLVIVAGRKIPIDWAEIKEVYNLAWELYIVFWDQERNLLFINGSGNNGWYKELAQAIAGETVELIKEVDVFRAFFGVNRLRLQNIGVVEQISRLIKYIMRAGSDVDAALTDAQRQSASFANVFGTGYENGERTSVGCSYKGRIWARKTGNLDEL